MPRCRVRGRGAAIEGHDPHSLHQRGDVQATHDVAFLPEQAPQHPAAGKGVLQVQLVDPTHQGQLGG